MSTSRSKYCVLGCLSSGPKSGYDIRMMMNEVTAFFWKESDGQLYPALKALLEDGCITLLESTGARNKKIYELTDSGRSLLREWLILPAADAQVRSEFLLKIFLGNELKREKVISHLERERQRIKERVARLRELTKSLENHQGNPRVVESWEMAMDAGVELTEAELRWCERCILALNIKIDQESIARDSDDNNHSF